jgi:leader peptidase (prepilin peptidase) / N-methyltransferase
LPPWLLPIVAAPFIGSFLGTAIKRLPAGEGMAWARSRCDHCGAALAARDLVPIASWAWHRGRCRQCGAWLGWFYPGIEVAAVAVALAAVAFDRGEPSRLWFDCLLGWALLTLAWIDLDRYTLPDLLTLPLLLMGLGVPAWEAPDRVTDHALAAAVGYVLFRTVALAYRRWRGRDGLGEGDAKLVAAGGAWLGLVSLSWLILIAAVAALAGAGLARLAGKRLDAATAIPFGPFLALALYALRLYPLGAI